MPAFTYIVVTEPLSREQLDSIGWANRQGIEDARILAKGLPELEPEDLQGLPSREVVLSLVVDAEVQPAVTGKTLPLGPPTGTAAAAREHSRITYGVDRQEAEAALLTRRGLSVEPPSKRGGRASKPQAQPRPHDAIGDVPDDLADKPEAEES